jgi:MoaA/NifB/PqqE/SkfB family radical SAM enzyme
MQWLASLFAPVLDWIQVEVTSQCNADCVYCPHTVFKDSWQDRHMPMEVYKRLSRAFPGTGLVYLQGWGEPLLHPQFFEMVDLARHCGCRVGTTTNGMLVGEEKAERMVSAGLSIVGFSLAGTDESQDAFRRRAPFEKVLLGMQRLHEAKMTHASPLPAIHVAYMWLRSQFDAVRALPRLLEGRGIRQAVVSTLDFVPRQELGREAIYAKNAAEEAFLRDIIAEVVEEGKSRGVDIVFRIVAPYRKPGTCTENVTKALFVSCRGLVSPCVLRNLPPVEGSSPTEGGLSVPESLIFGTLHDRGVAQIWREKSYKAFRRDHSMGRVPRACENCPKLFSAALG